MVQPPKTDFNAKSLIIPATVATTAALAYAALELLTHQPMSKAVAHYPSTSFVRSHPASILKNLLPTTLVVPSLASKQAQLVDSLRAQIDFNERFAETFRLPPVVTNLHPVWMTQNPEMSKIDITPAIEDAQMALNSITIKMNSIAKTASKHARSLVDIVKGYIPKPEMPTKLSMPQFSGTEKYDPMNVNQLRDSKKPQFGAVHLFGNRVG